MQVFNCSVVEIKVPTLSAKYADEDGAPVAFSVMIGAAVRFLMRVHLLPGLMIVGVAFMCVSVPVVAQNSDADSANSDKAWSATGESSYTSGVNNVRTSESHAKSGDRTVDKQSLQRVGPDGRYENFMDVETETVKMNATTTKTITKTFGRGVNGERTLVQVVEEQKQELPGGGSKSVRTASNPDSNGRLQLVQQDVRETKNLSRDTQETRSTTLLGDMNGNLSPTSRTIERQTKTSDSLTKFQKSTENQDLNGGWQLTEKREGTIRQDGKERTIEETLSRADANGRLAVAGRTVSKEVTDASGDTRSTVEKYSDLTPGAAPDGSLLLNERVTTVRKAGGDGSTTQRQVEAVNPGNPSSGLQVSSKTIDIVRTGPGGTTETRTTQRANGSGGLDTVQVDTRSSDQVPAVKVEIAPAKKAAPTKKAEVAPASKPK